MSRHIKGASVTLAPFFMFVSFVVHAEVPVVDIEDQQTVTPIQAVGNPANTTTGPRYPVTSSPAPAPVSATSRQGQLADLFTQLQQLQHEVLELRGLVEQQSNEIQTLKQQRKDDYIDMDRRLSALQNSGATAASGNTTNNDNADLQTPVATGAEKDSYDAAYQLLSQNHKDEAIAAFRNHILRFPDGEYAGNAYYWLGLTYFTQGQLDLAQEQFTTLLKKYPNHRKLSDAKFTLGKVYFQQGKKAEAKKWIEEVAQGSSTAAAPARAFLQANF